MQPRLKLTQSRFISVYVTLPSTRLHWCPRYVDNAHLILFNHSTAGAAPQVTALHLSIFQVKDVKKNTHPIPFIYYTNKKPFYSESQTPYTQSNIFPWRISSLAWIDNRLGGLHLRASRPHVAQRQQFKEIVSRVRARRASCHSSGHHALCSDFGACLKLIFSFYNIPSLWKM